MYSYTTCFSSLWFLDSLLRFSQAPVRSKTPAVSVVYVRYDPVRRLHHLNRVSAKQLPLVLDELAPEAAVGPDDGPTGLDPGVGLSQRHPVVLHEVRQAQRSGAAHSRRTMHQHRPPLASNAVDLISHAVEVQGDGRVRHVCQRDLHVLHVRPVKVGKLDGGVDHAGDAFGEQQAAVGRNIPPAEEEVGSDLSDPAQEVPILREEPGDGCRHHRAPVVVVVEETLTAGTHRGNKRSSRREAISKQEDSQEFKTIVVQRDQSDSS